MISSPRPGAYRKRRRSFRAVHNKKNGSSSNHRQALKARAFIWSKTPGPSRRKDRWSRSTSQTPISLMGASTTYVFMSSLKVLIRLRYLGSRKGWLGWPPIRTNSQPNSIKRIWTCTWQTTPSIDSTQPTFLIKTFKLIPKAISDHWLLRTSRCRTVAAIFKSCKAKLMK